MAADDKLESTEDAQTSTRWIYFAILGICAAFAVSYIYRPWRSDRVTRFAEQLLADPSEQRNKIHWKGTIRLGILHSRTGSMAISENSMVDAELLAVEEINAAGGLLGRQVEPIIADGRSDWGTFAREAENLISTGKVCTIIGCYTTASRKAVKTVVERHNHLLIYPKSYEGFELSPNIVYTGAAPNQQIIPAIKWSFDNIGRRFFYVGSDNASPLSISAIIRDEVRALGGELTGEAYIPIGSTRMRNVVQRIHQGRPDVIISSVVGDSNLALYRALRTGEVNPDRTPVVSVSIGEDELRELPGQQTVGDYAAWSYFQSLDRAENEEFVSRFKSRYGTDRVTSDVIQTAYFSVLLWAQAVTEAGSDDVHMIRKHLLEQSIDAPEGVVSIDPQTQHTWRSFSIGKIKANGQFEVVWTTRKPIRPVPFPLTRSRADWEVFLEDVRHRSEEDELFPLDQPGP
jgi:urea transport system substrate-binding protein